MRERQRKRYEESRALPCVDSLAQSFTASSISITGPPSSAAPAAPVLVSVPSAGSCGTHIHHSKEFHVLLKGFVQSGPASFSSKGDEWKLFVASNRAMFEAEEVMFQERGRERFFKD